MRVQTGAGFSLYSNEVTVTTLQALPAAPTNLQAAATSSSQVNLTWTNNAPDATAIRVEYLTAGSTNFADIGAAATLTSTGVPNLQPNTAYNFRVRAQNAAGYSAYSNVAMAKTLQALPAAPTSLQATAISSSQVNLTWTNNAPDATAIRVEYLPPSATTFTDIGAATTLTNSPVTNLQPNTTYSFRVRAQNAVGYSPYSNLATVTTQTPPVTVVLVHGILQSGGALEPLAKTLRPLLTPGRFTVLSDFNWGRCANPTGLFCDSNCTLEEGATELLNYLNTSVPPGDVIFVGYSMGGLIARQLLLTTQFSRNRPLALITLGTPNLGFPYSPIDALVICSSLGNEMSGDFRANGGQGNFSGYLLGLNNTWAASSPALARGQWLAISGTSCKNPIALGGGCPDSNVYSDGVVCDVSARLLFQYKNRPSDDLFSSNFFHYDGKLGLFCSNPNGVPALYNASGYSDVGQKLVTFINRQ
jgi:pimeloyl-ACP methyl ester carboxylesterase